MIVFHLYEIYHDCSCDHSYELIWFIRVNCDRKVVPNFNLI